MRKILIFTCFLTLGCFIYFIPVSMSVETICHSPPGASDDWQTISVDDDHLQFHLDHGDLLGACDSDCPVQCDDGNPCTRDDCDSAGGCIHLPVDCSDGRECTDDFCNEVTGLCDYVENCEEGMDCGYNSGECVACPQEVRHAIDAAIGTAARIRASLQEGIGVGTWCWKNDIYPGMPGWPEDILPTNYHGSWYFPNVGDFRTDGIVIGYVIDMAYSVWNEYDCQSMDNPLGYSYKPPNMFVDNGALNLFDDNNLIISGGNVTALPSNVNRQCAQDVDPVQIDQQILCAQKVARQLSDFGEPCLESAP